MGTEIGVKVAPIIENYAELVVPTIILYKSMKQPIKVISITLFMAEISLQYAYSLLFLDRNFPVSGVYFPIIHKLAVFYYMHPRV